MKKNLLIMLALVLALTALLLAGSACLTLRNQNAALTARLNALETELQNLKNTGAQPLPPEISETPEEQEAYCNLYLGDWTSDDKTLTLVTASAQVVTPAGNPLTGAALILELNGEACSTLVLEMNPGEASDSYELNLADFPLSLPALGRGSHLDLYLEATLSDGTVLSVCGGSWDWENGRLLMIAG